MNSVMLPTPTLLNTNSSPFRFCQQPAFWKCLGQILWQDYVPISETIQKSSADNHRHLLTADLCWHTPTQKPTGRNTSCNEQTFFAWLVHLLRPTCIRSCRRHTFRCIQYDPGENSWHDAIIVPPVRTTNNQLLVDAGSWKQNQKNERREWPWESIVLPHSGRQKSCNTCGLSVRTHQRNEFVDYSTLEELPVSML